MKLGELIVNPIVEGCPLSGVPLYRPKFGYGTLVVKSCGGSSSGFLWDPQFTNNMGTLGPHFHGVPKFLTLLP